MEQEFAFIAELKDGPLSTAKRLKLVRTLNDLPIGQFETLLTALAPPGGVVPSSTAPQGVRASALLQWIEGPTGKGLSELQDVLMQMLDVAFPSDRTDESSPLVRIQRNWTLDKKVMPKCCIEAKKGGLFEKNHLPLYQYASHQYRK
ncbi:MAG: hypothetical protein AAGD25_36415 [Cyanobacteria bacterium P01_F01_bin.150]